MRVQSGVPETFPVPKRRAHADATGAARHAVGTSSGLHPEDRPYLTDERPTLCRTDNTITTYRDARYQTSGTAADATRLTRSIPCL